MELREYQDEARLTDQLPPGDQIVPLLGMGGEVGSLLAEYKKFLRDGDAHVLFPEKIAEELGDILWYLANAATKFGLDLEAIAAANLRKTQDRWPSNGREPPYRLFDEGFPLEEQLPRRVTARFAEDRASGAKARIDVAIDWVAAGDPLQDNSHDVDGYKFHDVMHLAHAAKLGWSPVLRGKLLSPDRKRRSNRDIDEVEDGGRAIIIEEAVVAYVWEYARRHRFLEDVSTVDYRVLKAIKDLTSGLEVQARTMHQWQEAILAGYSIWRQVNEHRGGIVEADLLERKIERVD